MKCKKCGKDFTKKSNSQKYCSDCKKRICKRCGKKFSFELKNNSVYCSMDCYHRDRWGKFEKCEWCGENTSGKKFCSPKCQRDFWNKNDYHLNKKKRIWDRKIDIIKRLGGECVKCGIKDIRVLDINHIDREDKKIPHKREYNWTRRLKEWEQNEKNLELLCANCHRIHTWKQMGYGLNVELDKEYFEIAKKRIETN